MAKKSRGRQKSADNGKSPEGGKGMERMPLKECYDSKRSAEMI